MTYARVGVGLGVAHAASTQLAPGSGKKASKIPPRQGALNWVKDEMWRAYPQDGGVSAFNSSPAPDSLTKLTSVIHDAFKRGVPTAQLTRQVHYWAGDNSLARKAGMKVVVALTPWGAKPAASGQPSKFALVSAGQKSSPDVPKLVVGQPRATPRPASPASLTPAKKKWVAGQMRPSSQSKPSTPGPRPLKPPPPGPRPPGGSGPGPSDEGPVDDWNQDDWYQDPSQPQLVDVQQSDGSDPSLVRPVVGSQPGQQRDDVSVPVEDGDNIQDLPPEGETPETPPETPPKQNTLLWVLGGAALLAGAYYVATQKGAP